MPFDNQFTRDLAFLGDLDHKISQAIVGEELSVEDIAQLVDTREQILQSLLSAIEVQPELKTSQQWQDAVKRTVNVVQLMQDKTAEFGQALQKYRRGKRSVQQYQKFL
ncbi:flagellar protein FliT [Vibrio pacinii]|uniref:flagellar protein FliT n=1 Tax=Vibrio pacinii TaxID=170674 RepID=UPI000571F3E2|nr:flagellar protein FliT [Vibrio pacinii]